MAVILQNPDVVGIGNAIVDVLSRAEDAFRPQTQVSGVSRQEVSGTVYLSLLLTSRPKDRALTPIAKAGSQEVKHTVHKTTRSRAMAEGYRKARHRLRD